MSKILSILWFRQDLRLADNPALQKAVSLGEVLPVYILDDVTEGVVPMGGASRWWLHESLQRLNKSLAGKLWVAEGDPLKILPELAMKHGAAAVCWNRCYEPWRISRDKKVKTLLTEIGIEVHSFNGSLLFEPWEVLKGDSTPYKVFTPYYKAALTRLTPPQASPTPNFQSALLNLSTSETNVADLGLLPAIDWFNSIAQVWNPGEVGAEERLRRFLQHGLQNYKAGRDFPAMDAVSGLSPHLHFGEISPQQILIIATQAAAELKLEGQLEHFIRELFWRDFSYYLLYHFPKLTHENLRPQFDRFPWLAADENFAKWCKGQTGYPIVDAGMRQLWQTGTMHNRVRMIVASFLVKNLMIDWRHGAAWFWDCLVDADLASNSCSWQWVAGSGADAAPYFRIFNPITQGEKFDGKGEYVRNYLPELKSLPDKFIQCPNAAPTEVLAQAGIEIGNDYPAPIVDLKVSRNRALDAYKNLSG